MQKNLVHELQSHWHEVLAIYLVNNERDNYLRAGVKNFRQVGRVLIRIRLIMSTTLLPGMAGGTARTITGTSGRPM